MDFRRVFGCLVALALGLACRPEAPVEQTSGPAYVEAAACRDCHLEIWTSYMQTGMGRSFYRPRPENTVEPYDGAPYFHQASGRSYRMIRRDGKHYQRRHEAGPAGGETNVVEKEIHYVMGSGEHVRTYLHQKANGEMIELPLAWYSESGGKWAMNPGYDKRDHFGFQRLIAFDCMFCHNGYPEMAPGADFAGKRPAYMGRIPEGIDCQRCHGPGLAHLEALQRNASGEELAASIVNPARLSPERQMEVCYQCHLESTSRPLPNLLHRFGRGVFSYAPGEPLADYALFFDHEPGSKLEDKFEINHSAYRLRKSPCFIRSEGRLLCTTCHDPHGAPVTRPQAEVCGSCHEGLSALASHPKGDDCAACHMPKRRTDDVVHAVMTDHYIQRRPPPGNPLAPKREKHGQDIAYRGQVAPYYPQDVEPEYLALAQIAQDSNRDAGIRALEGLELSAELSYELAAAYERAGERDKAVNAFRRAAASPELTIARRRLGEALRLAGDLDQAAAELGRAINADPADSRARRELGLVYVQMGRPEAAAAELQAAIELDPELPENHNNLAGALLLMGREEQAEAAYREAIRLQPDLAEANFGLGNLLAARGEIGPAQRHWQTAIAGEPRSAPLRYNYAVTLIQQERWREAREQLEAAVAADPAMDSAQLALGELLLAEGRARQARVHLEKAAASADPAIRQAAREALAQL